MYLYKLSGKCTALQRIVHGGEIHAGNHLLLSKKNIITKNEIEEVPFISGNSILGHLRRIVMDDFFEQIGYKLTNNLVWFSFFNGGQLQAGEPYYETQIWNDLFRLCPPAALFAFSIGNQTFEGKLIVTDADLCCTENIPYLRNPENITHSYEELIASGLFTRKDDRLEKDESGQMFVTFDYIIPGSVFEHEFRIRKHPTSIEISCLHHMIKLWNENAIIGGKSAVGFGLLSLDYGELDDHLYLEFLQQYKQEIIDFLVQVTKKFEDQHKKAKAATKKKSTNQKALTFAEPKMEQFEDDEELPSDS
jgi:hypothetical protein